MDDVAPLLSIGTLTIDLESREVSCGEQTVGLTEMESRLLAHLWAHTGETVSQRELLTDVWGYSAHVESRAPHHTITRLRRKLSMDPEAADRLSTVRGIGYRLDGASPLIRRGAPPAHPTPFFGRAALLARVQDALAPGALVTLTGPGGIGKTRVAEQVAAQIDGGAVWVSLVDASSEARITQRIAAALGGGGGGEPLTVQLAQLSATLLVLDNAEQGVPALAALLGRWLGAVPALRVLVTSRFRLGLAAEQRVIVPPLPPADALALFSERTSRMWPSLVLNDTHRAALAQLEGVPLSIELAAGHAPMLGQGLALRSRHRDTPDRHASMQAVLSWSWTLLSPAQQQALAELSLFAGGLTPAAARAVLSEPARLLELEERSLVQVGAGRMRLLAHVRDFAARQRDATACAGAARRHAEHYAAMGEPDWLDGLWTEAGAKRQARLLGEQANLSVALDRALEAGWWELGAKLWLAAHGLLRRGHLHLDAARLERLMAAALPDPLRARLHATEGDYFRLSGQPVKARRSLEAALALLTDRPHEEAIVQCSLGACLVQSGEPDAAMALWRGTLAIFQQVGDLQREARALTNLGTYSPHEREHYYTEALQRARTVGEQWLVPRLLLALAKLYRQRSCWTLSEAYLQQTLDEADAQQDRAMRMDALVSLGNLHNERGEHAAAAAAYQDSLALAQALDQTVTQAILLGNLGLLSERTGALGEALRHYEQAVLITTDLSNAEVIGVARSRLGALLCQLGARERGHAMLEEAGTILGETSDYLQRSAHHCRAAEHAEDGAQAQRHFDEAWRLAEAADLAHGPLLELLQRTAERCGVARAQ